MGRRHEHNYCCKRCENREENKAQSVKYLEYFMTTIITITTITIIIVITIITTINITTIIITITITNIITTIAANFQSPSTADDSSSSRILSVTTLKVKVKSKSETTWKGRLGQHTKMPDSGFVKLPCFLWYCLLNIVRFIAY